MRALLFAIGGFGFGVVLLAVLAFNRWEAGPASDVLLALYSTPLSIIIGQPFVTFALTPVFCALAGLLLGLADWRPARRALLLLVLVYDLWIILLAAPVQLPGDPESFRLHWYIVERAWGNSAGRLLLGFGTVLIGHVVLWLVFVHARRRSRAGMPAPRQLQFGLKSLLLLPLVVSVPLGLIVHEFRRAEEQRQAVAALTEAGAAVNSRSFGQTPAWWQALFGDHFLVYTYSVAVEKPNTAFGDAAFAQLAKLPSVEIIQVPDTPVTDAGLASLPPLVHLINVNLENTGVTDAGMTHLSKHEGRGIAFLDLSGCQITDAGMAALKRFAGLNVLRLARTRITDEALASLAGASRLNGLYLEDTQITGSGLRYVPARGLVDLSLANTQVTNDALRHLEHFTRLEHLNLSHTRIGDAGLVHLLHFPSLTELNLSHTQVGDAGLETLRKLAQYLTMDFSGNRPGAKYLAGPAMATLDLSDTLVTDAGLKHLHDLPELANLDLSHTQVTDAGLETLKGIPTLHQLNLEDTQVTDEGAAKFKQNMPQTEVTR